MPTYQSSLKGYHVVKIHTQGVESILFVLCVSQGAPPAWTFLYARPREGQMYTATGRYGLALQQLGECTRVAAKPTYVYWNSYCTPWHNIIFVINSHFMVQIWLLSMQGNQLVRGVSFIEHVHFQHERWLLCFLRKDNLCVT